MTDDAPSSYANVTDGFTTADSYRSVCSWAGSTTVLNERHAWEKIREGSYAVGDTRAVYPHAHAEQSTECGVVVRRGWCKSYRTYTQAYYNGFGGGVGISDSWEEIDTIRVCVAGFKRVASEVDYYTPAPNNDPIRWKIESRDARDSVVCADHDHYIQEASGTQHLAQTWHTINGQLDGAGASTKKLTIGGPTNETDPGDTVSWRCFRLWARSDNASTYDLRLYHWHVWEILDADF